MGWMGEQVELCIQPCCTGSAVRYLIVLESILQSNPIVSGRCVPPWALRRWGLLWLYRLKIKGYERYKKNDGRRKIKLLHLPFVIVQSAPTFFVFILEAHLRDPSLVDWLRIHLHVSSVSTMSTTTIINMSGITGTRASGLVASAFLRRWPLCSGHSIEAGRILYIISDPASIFRPSARDSNIPRAFFPLGETAKVIG
jgi:hypothetical protein